MTIVIV